MKVLVFGASGGTGRELLKQALDNGLEVTAFVRDAAKVEDIQHPNLAVVTGNVLNMGDVRRAVAGHDAVLFSVGAGQQRTTIREQGSRIVIEAMQVANVKPCRYFPVCEPSFR